MMTDDEWAKRWAQAMPLNHRNGALVALRDDHHQAREEVRELRDALRLADGVMWMAEKYAEAGGTGGPEMREYVPAAAAVRRVLG